MRKEVLFAILLGLVLGLIITYGVYRARTSLQEGPNPSPTPAATVDPDSPTQTSLVLSAPTDETIQDSPAVTVAGTTDPNSFVVVVLNDDETITEADESGNFSVEETLAEGANVILVFSVNEDGQTVTQERTVIYTTEPLDPATDEPDTEANEAENETETDDTAEPAESEAEETATDPEDEI